MTALDLEISRLRLVVRILEELECWQTAEEFRAELVKLCRRREALCA
jgi:hypothetical protein